MRYRAATVGLITAALIGFAPPARAATIKLSLVQVIDTSLWAKPSTDPMGLGYNSATKRLLVTDSEVEETVPGQSAPCCWKNANFWETSLSGSVQSTSDLTPFTTEPTDVGYNPANGHYFIADDNTKTVYEITPGADGKIGTSDDTRRSFKLGYDAEGLDYGGGSLWIADGFAKKIHRIQPGTNGRFDGSGDDILTDFDVASLGVVEAEDVAYDPDNGTLFTTGRKHTTVIETNLTGTLLNSYDLSGTGMKNGSGIAIAPTSNNSSKRSIYIADRGADNDSNPTENDGKIFEYLLGAALPPGNVPVVTDPGEQSSFEGDTVNLQIVATDEDGDTLTFSATGLPPGLSIGSSTGRITGTIAAGSQPGSPYSVQVTASDGPRSGSTTFAWLIKDLVPPPAPAGLTVTSQTNGLALDWSNSSASDLAGYNVYRSATGNAGSFTKLNTTPLTASDYLDTQATLGAASFYEVRALDTSANESTSSAVNEVRSRIAFVSAATKNGSSSSLSITKPAGVAQGDLLLAGIAVRSAATINTPSGWTKFTDHSPSSSSTMRQAVFAKKAGSSEPSSYGFTFSSSIVAVGTIVVYRGADLPTLFGGQPNGSSRSITAPSLTPPAIAVEVGFFGTRANTTIAPAPGMLEQSEIASSSGLAIEAADDVVAAAPIGTRVATAGTSAVNVGQVVIIRPSNQTPVVTNPGSQTSLEGDSVTLPITATDAEGDPLTFSATGLPGGLSINTGTGAVSGAVAPGASAGSPYSVTVRAADGTTTGSTTFTWTVNDLVAPAAPAGFSSSSQTIALLLDWANSPELDLAGYNVYRSATGAAGSFTKVNPALLLTSAYTDPNAPAGATSYYEITAVDRSGNESSALSAGALRAKISFVAAASANGSVTSLTIARPAGVTQGDALLAVIGIRGTTTIPTPSGWTKITEHTTSGTTPLKQAVFSKLAGASEPASYAFSVGSSTVPATGTVSAYRGAALPVHASGGQPNASSASITAPSLTASVSSSVEVGFFGTALGTSITPPAGMLEQAETAITSPSNKITIETADDVVDAGALGTRVATAASAGVNVGQVVVLQPAGPQPPVVTNPGPQTNFDGDVVTLPITATDAEGGTIAYSATSLPSGLSMNAGTGVISGTVGAGASVLSPYSVTVTATDAEGSTNAVFTWTIKDPNAPVALDRVVAASSDDAEESPAGSVSPGGSDLELVTDGGAVQTVGVRFTGITVPAGASITTAWIQFQADEASSEATNLTIKGQAADNPGTFTTATSNVSSRARTTASVAWAPAAWSTIGEAGPNQRTPDLKSVLQEIVARPGWASGNAMAFIFTGTGRRVAEPFDGGPLDPALHIEYTTGPPPPPPNARPVVTNPGSQSNVEGDTVTLSVLATDPEGDPITYAASGLPPGLSIESSTGSITGIVSAGAATGSPYTVNVTASDAGGPGSATFTWTITDGSTPPPAPTTLNIVMSAPGDDVEEQASGAIDAGSSDLEIVTAGSSVQTVGLRFTGVTMPAGATVTAAWIQFQVDEASTGPASLLVRGEAADNAGAFTSAAFNVSSRPRTTSGAAWTPPDWTTVGDAGAAQRTSDLAAVLQEIVARAGWASGNAMAFIITGTGSRVAEAFEGGPLDPTLHVEYTTAAPANARPAVTNPGSQSNVEGDTVSLSVSASDPEGDPITYGATGLPPGLSISSSTGSITGVVSTGAATGSPYTVNVTASDAGGPGSATFTWTITSASTPPPAPTTLNIVMSAPADDMEEQASGAIDAGSSDLEIVAESTLQTVGLRFTGVPVPAGATITAAWIQFQVDEVGTGACNLLVQGEAADNAAAFTTATFNVSSRPRTSSGASWTPPAWTTVGDAGPDQRTADLAAVLQEIVARPGWASGNAVAFVITGTGKRTAESFEGGPLDPTLHIEYTT